MSFSSHELMGDKTLTGKLEEGNFGFVVTWRLHASAGDDGPDAAIDYVRTHIADLDDTYVLAATPNNSSASSEAPASADANDRSILKSIEVDREKGSAAPWLWLAKLSYEEPEGGGEGEKPDGSKTGDPTEFAAEIDVRTVQYSKFCDKAIYKSGFSGTAHTKVNDSTRRPIVNSALCVLDPPPEVDDHRWTIRIKKNVAAIDCDTVKCNVINTTEVFVNYRGITKTIPPLCGKTRDFSAVPVKHPAIGWYVQVELYIDVDERNDWRLEVLDRGFSARAMVNDKDGHGGTIGYGSLAFVEDIAPQRRIADAEAMPCSEPQLFNGNGKPLLKFTDITGAMTPVYSVWAHYTEDDFNAWPILADLIVPPASSA